VTLSKQTALLASGKRNPIRFSMLIETNRDTGSVRTDKCTHDPGKAYEKRKPFPCESTHEWKRCTEPACPTGHVAGRVGFSKYNHVPGSVPIDKTII